MTLSPRDAYSVITGVIIGGIILLTLICAYGRVRARTKRSHLIYIHGVTGSGKDTAANFLPLTHRFAHADHLKQIVMLVYDLSREQVYDEVLKEQVVEEWGASPRQLLQDLGTYLRSKHPDIFIRKIEKNISKARRDHPKPTIAVTDCRYDNEAESGRALGATVIRIERDPATLPACKSRGHVSERGISEHLVDHVVQNPGKDLAAFKAAVKELFARMDRGEGGADAVAPRLASSAVSAT